MTALGLISGPLLTIAPGVMCNVTDGIPGKGVPLLWFGGPEGQSLFAALLAGWTGLKFCSFWQHISQSVDVWTDKTGPQKFSKIVFQQKHEMPSGVSDD